MNLRGTITALVTPFKGEQLDEEGLVANIHFQIEQGVDALVVMGTTGESPTLSSVEQEQVIRIAVKETQGKVPIWVGTGRYCTRQTIEQTQRAQDLGADVALVVTPYYNRPTQEGVYQHFKAISTNVEIPIVIYHIPARTATSIDVATMCKLADLPHIAGIKDSSGNINYVGELIHFLSQTHPHVAILSGDDILALPIMALGGHGLVSVVSNLVPAQIVALVKAALSGELVQAQALHHQLLPLFKAAFIETNPIPIKAAMNFCGMAAGECRLPLSSMQPENWAILKEVLVRMNLIECLV